MINIIKKHFSEIKKILQNSDDLIDKTNKISLFLSKKIKSKKKFMYMVMGALLPMPHILLVN